MQALALYLGVRGEESYFSDAVERGVGDCLSDLGRFDEALVVAEGLLTHLEWKAAADTRSASLYQSQAASARSWIKELEDRAARNSRPGDHW